MIWRWHDLAALGPQISDRAPSNSAAAFGSGGARARSCACRRCGGQCGAAAQRQAADAAGRGSAQAACYGAARTVTHLTHFSA